MAPSGGGLAHGEAGKIVKQDVNIEEDDEDWDVEGIVKAKEFEISELRSYRRSLLEKCRSTSANVSAELMTIVAVGGQSLNLGRTVTKRN